MAAQHPQIANLSFTNFYDVLNQADDEVNARFLIGHGQMAVTSIMKNNQKIADAISGEDLPFDLGSNKSLIGSTVQITVTVFDVPDVNENLETSVSITLSGGKSVFQKTFSFKVQNQNDIVNYTFNFFFF